MELNRREQFVLAAMQAYITNTGPRNIPNIKYITNMAIETADVILMKLDDDNPGTKQLLCEEIKSNVGDREIL